MKKKSFSLVMMVVLSGLILIGLCGRVLATEEELVYQIHPGDVLEINVFGAKYMHNPPFKLRVSEDGTVSFPLIGTVKLAGLTEGEAISKLNSMLIDGYLQDPQVTLFVREKGLWGTAERHFSVSGAVKKPGKYIWEGQVKLIDAINAAGGTLPPANKSQIKIAREESGKMKKYIVDLDKRGGEFIIIGQDMITVEEYGTYFIHGQVVRPGEYLLGEDLMASRAIALAGGFTDIANQNGVQVIRKLEGGKTKIIKVPVATILKTGRSDKDVLLQEGDTVVVSESWF